MAPIPVFLAGKHEGHRQASINMVKPEFEIVATADSEESILNNLPPLLAASKVSAIVVGGGFSNEVLDQLMSQVDGARSVPWIRPEMLRPGHVPSSYLPPPEVIATRLRKTLDEHHEELKAGEGKGETWYF